MQMAKTIALEHTNQKYVVQFTPYILARYTDSGAQSDALILYSTF